MIDDIFPQIERVRYAAAPLVQVVAQFAYPTILKVESASPVDFQESVRSAFPIFERQSATFPGAGLPPEIARLLAIAPGTTGYVFASADRTNSVTLTPQNLTFTSARYERWEAFKSTYAGALDALLSIYKPSYFDRVGLRYSNAIDRTALGTAEPWSRLLSPRILGELSDSNVEAGVVDARRVLQVTDVATAESFILQHGLNGVPARPGAYAIDFDFFISQRTEIEHAREILDRFHGRASRAFRWCIRDELHQLLRPSIDGAGTAVRGYGT